jgi:hypothetical protein
MSLWWRQLPPQSSQTLGCLSLKNLACLPGPVGPPKIAGWQASASSAATGPSQNGVPPREGRKTGPPGARRGSLDGPAGARAFFVRDRGRSQSFAAARLIISAPSGSEGASFAMQNISRFGLRTADSPDRVAEWKSKEQLRKSEPAADDCPLPLEWVKVPAGNSEEP